MQVYLHIYIHIYIQVDTFYATKLNFGIFAQTRPLMHWLSWEPLCEPNFYVFLY